MECPAGIAYGIFLVDSCVARLEDLMKAHIRSNHCVVIYGFLNSRH